MAKKKKVRRDAEKTALREDLLDQLNGVLLCTLAACEEAEGVPKAILNSLYAAARLSQEAQQII